MGTAKKGGLTVLIFLVLQNGVSFLSQLIMARLIAPDAFGLIAMAMLIGMFFQVIFNTQGDKFIIQSKEDSKKILNVIISFELTYAIFFMVIICFSANYITKLLGREDLTFLIQLLTISYIATPFQKIRAFFEKDLLMFKSKISLFISQILGGIIGVVLAIYDFGVYALVIWRIATPVIDALILLFLIKFNIKIHFSGSTIKKVYSFTWPLIISGTLIYFIYNIDYYIVGYFEDYKSLGYYWLAFQVSHYFLTAKTAINSVLFPTFSKLELERDKINLFNKIIKITSLLYTLPALLFLLYGNYIVSFLYGEKWMPALLPLQIFFIIVAVKAIGSNVGPFFYSLGKTKQDISISIINAITLPLIVSILVFWHGINGAAFGVLISAGLNAIYGFVRYVTPLTKKSVFYYYGKTGLLFLLVTLLIFLKKSYLNFDGIIVNIIALFSVSFIYLLIFKNELKLLKSIINNHILRKNV